MICLHHESSLSAQPHLYCVRAWMRFFSLTDRRTLCYLFKEFVGYRARKKADYQHTNIIVWINCLSLAATPLCYLSVCKRQLIRTKVRMDSNLSAQPIASSSYLRTEIHSLIRYHLRKEIHSLSSLSAQSIASSSYLRTEIHSSNILWKAIDPHKG